MNRLSTSIRVVLLLVLAMALWNPRLPWQAPAIDLAVLVDASDSIDPAAMALAWQDTTRVARELPAGSRLTVLRFGNDTVVESPWNDVHDSTTRSLLAQASPPARRHVDSTGTQIATALDRALRMARPGRSTHIALLSDGRATGGAAEDLLRQARDSGIPVHAMEPPMTAAGNDSWIRAWHTPDRITAGQVLPVSVTLASHRNSAATVDFILDGVVQETRELTLSTNRDTTLHTELALPSSGTPTLTVTLDTPGDREPRNNSVSQIININGTRPVLYVSHDPAAATLAHSLYNGGWPVTLVSPRRLASRLAQDDTGVIVLDNIAATDMPDSTWEQLTSTVSRDGSGLLVLGGDNAFGAGGYRHSVLEGILPVTAQARVPQAPAAVLFMLDTSGSMDRHSGEASRLQLARQAVQASARTLQADDETGLIEFDVAARTVLPLARHTDPAAAINSAPQVLPSGGTRLRPALTAALAALAKTEAPQRFLVLVTDGFVDEGSLADLEQQIADSGIDVIALAVGRKTDHAVLSRLTRINQGRLLTVDDVAQLPRLMQAELDERRPLLARGDFQPTEINPLPFLDKGAQPWPRVSSYAVTREKAGARVFLRIADDPLLVSQRAGAGRVAVLTSGIGNGTAAWSGWPLSGRLAGGLIDWLGGQGGLNSLHVSVDTVAAETTITVEQAPDSTLPGVALAVIRDPNGHTATSALTNTAPGHHEAVISTPIPGRYLATLQVGDNHVQHAWRHDAVREFTPAGSGPSPLARWQAAGLVTPWSAAAPGTPGSKPRGMLRTPLLMVALFLLLALLAWERRPDLFKQGGVMTRDSWRIATGRMQLLASRILNTHRTRHQS